MIAIAEVLGNVLRKINLDQQDEMTEKLRSYIQTYKPPQDLKDDEEEEEEMTHFGENIEEEEK